MKSSLRKLRGFAQPNKGRRRAATKMDDLVQATEDMLDMRNSYDSLVSAAATITNTTFEFSEALQEMGTCLLEKASLIDDDDDDGGRVLLMLGKTQFKLQKLVDNYRAHIIQTITTPSESLLQELQTVEEMKQQSDNKRDLYKSMLASQREKGRSRNVTFSSQQLQAAQDDYEKDAFLFISRLESLKQGQSRSLMIQAARHHAAQLCFFRKGLTSLELVETHVKAVAEQQHIDYQFRGLDDDATKNDDDNFDYSYDDNDESELSFDYGLNEQGQDVLSTSRNSMELDQEDCTHTKASSMEPPRDFAGKIGEEISSFRRSSSVSQSAPIHGNNFVPSEKTKGTWSSSEWKFDTYPLPIPVDSKNSDFQKQLSHSSPLQPHKFVKNPRDGSSPSPSRPVMNKPVLKESNINSSPKRMPPPLAKELRLPQPGPHTTDAKSFIRNAFSGPLTSKTALNKPMNIPSLEYSPVHVRMIHTYVSPRVSPTASPPPMPSPKVTELHELPRPPISFAKRTRPTSLIGHSAPLVSKGHEFSIAGKMPTFASRTASPLPTPAAAMARSLSIPSGSRRMPVQVVAKLFGDPVVDMIEGDTSPNFPLLQRHSASPPLTPIYQRATHRMSASSELASQAYRT